MAEKLVGRFFGYISFRSLQNGKFSGGGYPKYTPDPPTKIVPSALEIMSLPPPRYKTPSYGPAEAMLCVLMRLMS